ncbi:MAG: hypothetical protein H6707_13775 [Deltaproteobacteria bacterium]|nr:hypothetical protein [Deltaproteobacteria bacterium]
MVRRSRAAGEREGCSVDDLGGQAEVAQDFGGNAVVLDHGDEAHAALAAGACEGVEAEASAQKLRPGSAVMQRNRYFVVGIVGDPVSRDLCW